MNNLDRSLDVILEDLHNSWLVDDYDPVDPAAIDAKRELKALISKATQELST